MKGMERHQIFHQHPWLSWKTATQLDPSNPFCFFPPSSCFGVYWWVPGIGRKWKESTCLPLTSLSLEVSVFYCQLVQAPSMTATTRKEKQNPPHPTPPPLQSFTDCVATGLMDHGDDDDATYLMQPKHINNKSQKQIEFCCRSMILYWWFCIDVFV